MKRNKVLTYLLFLLLPLAVGGLAALVTYHGMPVYEQLDLFSGGLLSDGTKEKDMQKEKEHLEKEKHLLEAMLSVKSKYGKNAILRAADLQEGATTIDRNRQIGGHKA